MDRSIRRTVILLVTVVLLIFSAVVGRQLLLVTDVQPASAPELAGLNTYVYDEGRPLADFQLLDEHGDTVTRESLKGQWTFAFVGYTNCPDVCPTAMANLRRMDSQLPGELPQPRYLLVTADPQHDTPEKLRDYVGFFGDHFHGLTGDPDTLEKLAKSLNAVIMQRQVDGELQVDHSGHFALINPQGEMIAVIQPPHDPADLLQAYRRIQEWWQGRQTRAGQS